jgi:hypothetical protein
VKTFPPRRILCHTPLSRDAGFLERAQLFPDIIRDSRTHHPVLICFPTLVARTHRLPVGDSLPRSRSIQGPWTTPLDPHLPSCSTWWPESCCRLARTHYPVAGTHTGPQDPHWSPGPTLVPGPTAIPRHPTSPAEAPPAELTREPGIEPLTK